MNTHRYQIVAFLLLLVFCSKASAQNKDWSVELDRGYAAKTNKPLDDFLADWHSKSKPVSDKLLNKKPAFEKAVYSLYTAFFKPAKFYQKTEYAVIQNEVDVLLTSNNVEVFDKDDGNVETRFLECGDLSPLSFTKNLSEIDTLFVQENGMEIESGDKSPHSKIWLRQSRARYLVDSGLRPVFDAETFDRESSVRSLPQISHFVVKDFRPPIQLDNKKVLYLEPTRLVAMLGFLTEDNGHRMIDRYWDEDCTSKERKQRLQYLNSAMEIIPGHWSTGWHFQTHPHINEIFLSSDFRKAVVCYRIHYGGGEALMERKDDRGWKIVEMEDTWTE